MTDDEVKDEDTRLAYEAEHALTVDDLRRAREDAAADLEQARRDDAEMLARFSGN